MGSQRVAQDLATEQQEFYKTTVVSIQKYNSLLFIFVFDDLAKLITSDCACRFCTLHVYHHIMCKEHCITSSLAISILPKPFCWFILWLGLLDG